MVGLEVLEAALAEQATPVFRQAYLREGVIGQRAPMKDATLTQLLGPGLLRVEPLGTVLSLVLGAYRVLSQGQAVQNS